MRHNGEKVYLAGRTHSRPGAGTGAASDIEARCHVEACFDVEVAGIGVPAGNEVVLVFHLAFDLRLDHHPRAYPITRGCTLVPSRT